MITPITGPAIADPSIVVGSGNAEVQWNFTNPANYTLDNSSISGGLVQLNKTENAWFIDDTETDFYQGALDNTTVTLSGDVRLTGTQWQSKGWIKNPEFTSDSNWTYDDGGGGVPEANWYAGSQSTRFNLSMPTNTSPDLQFDSMDTNANGWVEYGSNGNGVFNFQSTVMVEGTGSVNLTFTHPTNNEWYGLSLQNGPWDWSGYNRVLIGVNSTGANNEELQIVIEDTSAVQWTSASVMMNPGWNRYSIDISGCPADLSQVNLFAFEFGMTIDETTVFVDDIRLDLYNGVDDDATASQVFYKPTKTNMTIFAPYVKEYTPDEYTLVAGSRTVGKLDRVQQVDGKVQTHETDNGGPPKRIFDGRYNITVTEPYPISLGVLSLAEVGSGSDDWYIQIYNFSAASWETLHTFTSTDSSPTWRNTSVPGNIFNYINNTQVRLRIENPPGGGNNDRFYIDYLAAEVGGNFQLAPNQVVLSFSLAKDIRENITTSELRVTINNTVLSTTWTDTWTVTAPWTSTELDISPFMIEPGNYTVTLGLYARVDTKSTVDLAARFDNVFFKGNATVPLMGNFTSRVFDAGSIAVWNDIEWYNSTTGPGTNLIIQTRTGNFSTPDLSWSPWTQQTNASPISSPKGKYIQYCVNMSTSDGNFTPVLEYMNMSFTSYPNNGSIETQDFIPSNVLEWWVFDALVTIPPKTSILFWYSTDSGMSWLPVNTGDNLSAAPLSTIRFRAWLNTTDTTVTPALDHINLTYKKSPPDGEIPQILDTTFSTLTTGDTFTVTATVTDNIGVGAVYLFYWFDLYGGGTDGPYNGTMNPSFFLDINPPADAVALHYNISAKDTSDNWNETGEVVIVVLDNDAPVIVDTTSGFPTTGDNFNITASISDSTEVDGTHVYYWFDLYGGGLDGPYNLTMPVLSRVVNVPGNAVAVHYNISANDTSNNWNETGEIVIGVLDNDTPLAMDTTPGSPTTGDIFQVTATITDNIDVGDVNLYYWFDLYGGGTDGPYNVTMDPGYLKDIGVPSNAVALHYNISAKDTSNNWNETGEVVIAILDNDSPAVLDTTSGSPTTGETFQITASVTDNINTSDVYLFFWLDLHGGGTDGPYYVTMDSGFSKDISVPTNAVALHYNISANDTVDNWNEIGEIVIGVLDNDTPSVMDMTPGLPTTGDTFQITAIATDIIDVDDVYLYYWFDLYGGGTDGPYNVKMDPGFLKDISVPSNAVFLHYNISANDTSNNWNETGEILCGILDNDPPIIIDTTPDSPVPDSTFTIQAMVSDNLEVDLVSLYYWLDLFGGGTDGPYNITMDSGFSKDINIPSNAVALHYNISANDTTNNWNETGEITIGILDNDLPEILDTTSGSPTTGDIFQITSIVTDNIDVGDVYLYYWFDLYGGGMDGPYNVTMDPGFSKDINVANNALTLHYNISANDTTNNWNETGEFVIGVMDNDTPSVLDTTSGSPTTGDTFQITATVTDNIDVGDVYLYYWFDLYGGGTDGPYNVTMDPGFSKDVAVPSNAIQLHYDISANDTSDNWDQIIQSNAPVTDNDLPSISDTTSGSPKTGDAFIIAAAVTDNIAVDEVFLYYWFETGVGPTAALYVAMNSVGGGDYDYQINVPGNGLILHYNISAKDTANNWDETGDATIAIQDNDPPQIIDFNANPPSQETGLWVNITVEALDMIGVSQALVNITFPNGSWIVTNMENDAGDGWFYNATFSNLGNYSYRIRVVDSEGNYNLSTAKQFQIMPPQVPGVDYIQINTAPNNGGSVQTSIVIQIGEPMQLYAAAFNNSIGYLGDVEVTWLCNNPVAGEVIPTYGSNTTFTALENGTGTVYAIYNIIENSTEFEVLPRQEPTILGTIPDLELLEDFPRYTIDLTKYAHDNEDSKSNLSWYVTGENEIVLYIYGENKTGTHEIWLYSMKDMHGNMEVTYWLVDSDGYLTWQQAWINVTPVNDPPEIWGCPDIYVHYDTPYTFDYSAYVSDLDTPLSEMTLTCDVEGYSAISGLDITYSYPQSMVGRDMYATLTISDGELSDSELIMITVTTDYPPVSVSKLPDIIIYENDTIHSVFDLDDFISDPDGDSLYMSYGYTHLNITINDDHTVDFSALGEWTGTETVTFRAEDPMGAMVEQTIIVTVVNVNDPPAIKPLPPFVVHYGHPFIFDLFWYISDNDNETEELVLTTSNPDNVSVEGTVLTLIYPEHWEGQPQPYIMPLIVYVSDGMFMVSGVTTVKVGDDYPPHLTQPLEDLSFFEDEPAIGAYNLDEHFGDIDSSTMFYTSGNVRINVTIQENHTIDFSAPPNWYGSEYILIRASDEEEAFAEATILVTVLQVNDPPQIADLPAQFGEKGKTWVLDLEEYISDIDNDLGNLNISVDSPYVSVVGYMLVFSYPEDITEDTVEITVSDGDLETTVPLNVVITTSSEPTNEEPWLWFLIILILVVAVLALLLARIGIYKVEDVFLISTSGLLIEHAGITQNEKQAREKGEDEGGEKDDDILAAMFVAVQQFIKDAFSKDSEDEDILKRMDYGDKTVMIFKGEYVILSAFLSGQTTKSFYRKMEDFVVDVEDRYKHDFETWEGTIGSLPGVREMLNSFLEESYVKGEWKKEN